MRARGRERGHGDPEALAVGVGDGRHRAWCTRTGPRDRAELAVSPAA
jgi:hypothetical protein